MSFAIFETSVHSRTKLTTPEFASVDAAIEWVKTGPFGKILVYVEKDEDNDAADFVTKIGGVYQIEPA